MTENRTRTPVYLDPGMHPGLEVKGLSLHGSYKKMSALYGLSANSDYDYLLTI